MDAVLSAANIYIPVLQALKNATSLSEEKTEIEYNYEQKNDNNQTPTNHIENKNIAQKLKFQSSTWCSTTGEAECLEVALNQLGSDCKWIAASGITQALEILENTEDGQFDDCDYLEISACTGGCLGGPLTAVSAPVAEAILRRRLHKERNSNDKPRFEQSHIHFQDVLFTKDIIRDFYIFDWDGLIIPTGLFQNAAHCFLSMQSILVYRA